MICALDKKFPQVREEIQSLADKLGMRYETARVIYENNNGYGLDKAPTGADSKLYQTLLEHYGDETLALQAKAKVYLQPFFDWFGDWTLYDDSASKVVDENGEPLVVYHHTDNENLDEFSTEFDNYFAKTGGTKDAIFFDENTTGTLNRKYDLPVFLNIRQLTTYTGTKEDLHKKGTDYREVVNNSANANKTSGGLHMAQFDDNRMVDQSIWIIHNVNNVKSVDNRGTFSTTDNKIRHQSNRGIKNRRKHFNTEEWALSTRLSNILQELFPELSVEYVESIAGGYVGEADLDALKILIDIAESGLDTLPHEYAHYYVDMFRDSELVTQGIELFGSEEALVQAVGVRTVEMEGKARTWWQKFKDFIKKSLNKNKYAKEALLAELTDAFLTRQKLSTNINKTTGIKHQTNLSISQVRDTLRGIASKIKFDDKSHTYTNGSTGVILTPVSTKKEELGYSNYDETQEDAEQAQLSDDSRQIGSDVHLIFELMFTDRFTGSYKGKTFNYSAKTINNIQTIVNNLKKDYDFVASEAMIADLDVNIAGTCDLILRDKKTGEYVLADFKTKLYKLDGKREKKNGKKLWGFKYLNSYKYNPKTSRDAYDYQLSAYAYMLNKLGVKVTKRAIIPLLYERKGTNIENLYLSEKMGEQDVKTNGLYEIVQSQSTKFDVDVRTFQDTKGIPVNEDYFERLSERFAKVTKDIRTQLSKTSTLFKIQGRNIQAREIDYNLDKVANLAEGEMFLSYLTLVTEQLKKFNDQIQKRYKNPTESLWNLDSLQTYHEIASCYNLVDDIIGAVDEFHQAFTEDQANKIKKAAQELKYIKGQILAAYENKGGELYMSVITPYIENIKDKFRDDAIAEYRSTHATVNQDELDKYVQNYLDTHADEIKKRTQRWLTEQRSKADKMFEPNQLLMQLDTVYNSKDPFVQASVIYFDRTMQECDHQLILWRNKAAKLVNEYAKKYAGGYFADQQKLYEDLVEIIDGQAYLVSDISNQYLIEYKRAYDEIWESSDNDKTKREKWRNWLDANAPIDDVKGYNSELKARIDTIKEGLTKEQKKAIDENMKLAAKDKKKWQYFYMKKILDNDTVKALEQTEIELDNIYRIPLRSKYPNQKYQKLLELKKTDDVKYRLWEFLHETQLKGDTGIQRRLKLNNRLPGVRKQGMERVSENGMKGVKDAGTAYIKESFALVEDDDIRNGSFVDINGNRIQQVPMFYINRVSIEDQSFDLPTIYGKWYGQTLEHKAKKQIESYMNYTTHILRTRQTQTNSDSLLEKAKKALKGKQKEQEAAYEKATNLLNQWEAFMDQVFYGNQVEDLGKTGKVDHAKAIKSLLNWYSWRVMGLNFHSMFNNALVGEVQQIEEAFAGQYMSKESYHKASKLYLKNIFGMLEDVGKRVPEHKFNRLCQWFGVFQPKPTNMRGRFEYGITDITYWTTDVGERELQTRFLLGNLIERKAKDKDGKVLGSLLDYLDFDEDGQLIITDENVANYPKEELHRLSLEVRAIAMEMHGNYNERMRVAAQQHWYGWLGLSMRKWIVPGFVRRFGGEYYDNIRRTHKGGFYRIGSRCVAHMPFAISLVNFFRKIVSHGKLEQLKATRWDELKDYEKRNTRRFLTELGVMAFALVMTAVLGSVSDDDDDEPNLWFLNFQYQMERLWSDVTFYWNPASFLRIMQDPFPSMSLASNIVRLFNQLTEPFEVYKYGSKKGESKLGYQINQLFPVIRQIGRFSNIEEEMELFNSAL